MGSSKSKLLSGELTKGSGIASATEAYGSATLWTPHPCLGFTIATGGGIPQGRIVEFFGEYSSGKSVAAYQEIAETQRMGGLGVLIDVEGSYDPIFGAKLGINNDELIIYPENIHAEKANENENKQLIEARSVEKVSVFMEELCTKARKYYENPLPVTVVLDSVAALSTKKLAEKDMDKSKQDMTKAKLIGNFETRLTGILKKNNITLILINQMRDKIVADGSKPVGDKWTTPGGKATGFYATIRVMFIKNRHYDKEKRIFSGQVEDENGIKIGQMTDIYIAKNKLYPPFMKGTILANFDKFEGNWGFDTFYGITLFLQRERILE